MSHESEQRGKPSTGGDGKLQERARRLVRDAVVLDAHIDLPHRLFHSDEDVTVRTTGGDFDLVRAREGGLDGAFLAAYVPAALQTGDARAHADLLIDRVVELVNGSDAMAFARSPQELLEGVEAGRFCCPLGLENGAALEGDLAALGHFRRRGVCYVTLAHGSNNDICDSSYDAEPLWRGLSPFGRRLVREMNDSGVMVDLSHVTDEAFDQAVNCSRAPVIASHSSCRHFTPGSTRNLDDERIERLAATGGLIAINFGSAFLTDVCYRRARSQWSALEAIARRDGLDPYSPAARELLAREANGPEPVFADVEDVADHIQHAGELAGWSHVALGSDFEGVGDTLPTGLKDVSGYPNLVASLLGRGIDEGAIRGVLGGNLLRVWGAVQEAAARP